MNLFIKLLVAFLVIGLLLPFTFLKGKDGKPILSITDLKLPEVSMPDISLPDISLPEMPKLSNGVQELNGGPLNGEDVIYKWTDKEGNMQFSDSPPPEGIEFTAKGYDSNLNVVQAVEIPSDEPELVLKTEPREKVISAEGIGGAYSPENIENLFKDAKNIEKVLNQRFTNQKAELGQ